MHRPLLTQPGEIDPYSPTQLGADIPTHPRKESQLFPPRPDGSGPQKDGQRWGFGAYRLGLDAVPGISGAGRAMRRREIRRRLKQPIRPSHHTQRQEETGLCRLEKRLNA